MLEATSLRKAPFSPGTHGETRLVTHAFVRPGRGTRFVRHARCVSAALAREVLAAHGSVERVPVGGGLDEGCVNDAREQIQKKATL